MDLRAFTRPSGDIITVPAATQLDAYLAFVPHPLPPPTEEDAITAVRPLLSEADQALGELIGIGRLLPDPDLLVRPYLRQEAVASSAIEGTKATFADLVTYEAARVAGPGSDVVDLLNYTAALEQGLHAVQQGDHITSDLVRRLHRTLMTNARGEDFSTPGEFRTIQNHIGGGRQPSDGDFVPPPPKEMQDCLDRLFAYLANRNPRTPILVEAAWIHYQFETIHPFIDGNGRVGRLLIPLLLAHRRHYPHPLLYLSPYFRKHRTRYNELLFDVSAQSAWNEWLRFFLEGVIERALDATTLADRIIALGRDWQQRLQEQRAPLNAHRLADYVHRSIAVNASTAERHLEVTGPTAYKAISVLEQAGILEEITGRPRDRVWLSRELLGMLQMNV